MSWTDDLLNFGGDLVDMVGEVGGSAVNAWVTTEVATKQEVAAQPETSQQREPVKGTNADGTPIVQSGKYPANPMNQQIIAGVSNQTLMFAALGIVAVFALRPKG